MINKSVSAYIKAFSLKSLASSFLLQTLPYLNILCLSRKAVYVALALSFSSSASGLTCSELNGAYLYSQENNPVYLGFFGSQYASDSVMNQYGTYGSQYNSSSVRNTFGTYGSSYNTYSANNNFSNSAPKIFKNNVLIGYLTTNQFTPSGITLSSIDSSCTFNATSASISVSVPSRLINLISAVNTTQVGLSWAVSSGATGYKVFQCSSTACSSPTLLGTALSNSTIINSLNPSQTYYFAVEPFNSAGVGAYGVITVTTLADTTAPVISLTGAANITHPLGDEFSDPGATATDAVDGAVTVTVTGSVDVNTAGTYVLTYSASDAAGNSATQVIRTVVVPAPDSDGDGYTDAEEIADGTDPLDANSAPIGGMSLILIKAFLDKQKAEQ